MHYRLIPKAALCEIQPCPCAHYDGYHQELLLGCHEISSTHQCWELLTQLADFRSVTVASERDW